MWWLAASAWLLRRCCRSSPHTSSSAAAPAQQQVGAACAAQSLPGAGAAFPYAARSERRQASAPLVNPPARMFSCVPSLPVGGRRLRCYADVARAALGPTGAALTDLSLALHCFGAPACCACPLLLMHRSQHCCTACYKTEQSSSAVSPHAICPTWPALHWLIVAALASLASARRHATLPSSC